MRQPAQMSTRGGRKTVTRMVEPVGDIVNLNDIKTQSDKPLLERN